MGNNVLISDDELKAFGSINNLSEKAKALLQHQKENWDLVNDNFGALDSVKTKKFIIDDYELKTQFNPSRIISSSAKVDKKSIETRACFLCNENLPNVQKGIDYKGKYVILCNPYPIFKQHLTIPHLKHIPQNINDAFPELLELSYDLRDDFFVFYNGSKCGASAPDHLHFQAGEKNSTPLESYYKSWINNAEVILANDDIKIGSVTDSIYDFVFLESNKKELIISYFDKMISTLSEIQKSTEEPLLNLICFYEEEKWNLIVVPRKSHRPKQFFNEGENRLLISPASVDIMGLLITPREEDFNKLTIEEIKDIYDQVLFDKQFLQSLLQNYE